MGHHLLDREHLRILGDGRNLLCPLTAVETNHGKWATGWWLDRLLKTVTTTSGAAPILVMAYVAVVMLGGPPPGSNFTREVLVWQVNGASSGGHGG
jgi:hypothetical protein